MPRLRTPDGRPLERSTSTLRVAGGTEHFRDPPGGLTAHPERLAPFLRAVGGLLDKEMHRAEHDETLGVRQQEHVIQSVLLGQAVGLGLEAYAAHRDRELLELVNDLAATLEAISPLGQGLMERLPAINAAAGLAWLTGVPLLPQEVEHAVALVLDHLARAGVPVPPEARARLDWAGYRRPGHLNNPLHPIRSVLTPPATREPARFAREQDLQALARGAAEGERNAALLLLHVNGRDRLENAPLVSVLDTARVLLLSLQRAGNSPAVNTLAALHGQLLGELGSPHLPMTQRFRRQHAADPETHTWAARRLLRALRHDRQREPTPREERHLEALWDALDALDRDLAAGVTPEHDDALRARLLLLSLQGLTATSRAPGMSLPPMVQLAAQVSGVDPLWEWERTQPGARFEVDLHEDLGLLLRSNLLVDLRGTDYWETWGPRVRRLTGLAAGHLLATVRRAGVRLPEQAFLEGYYAGFGPLRALPLSPHERASLDGACHEALSAARDTVEVLRGQETEEVLEPEAEERISNSPAAGPAGLAPDGPSVPSGPHLPAHVVAARERLSGQRVVLLGGVPSPQHRAALVETLNLRELDWIGSGEYAHGTHAEARVTPDTAVVILAIRWMGHAHNTLRDVARAREVPFVMHPGGLSPSSVAWQVMQQVSRQLDARRALTAGAG